MTDRSVVSQIAISTVPYAYCNAPECVVQGDTLKMNVYKPVTMSGNIPMPERFPLMVFFSGGGFYTGDRNMAQWPEAFARRGYIVVTPDYRVGWDRNNDGVIDGVDFSDTLVSGDCQGNPQSLMRAIIRARIDAHSVIRFVLGNPTEYPVDTSLIYVGGPSAGGTLALTAAFATDQQMLDYWAAFSGAIPVEQSPCDMHYEVRPCPLLGPEYTAPYRIRGVVNCWGQAVISPDNGDPGPVDLISFFGAFDKVNPPGVGTTLGCSWAPIAFGSLGMHDRQLLFGNCVKTIEDINAKHRTVFLDDIDSTNFNASQSAKKGERANFIAQQANCFFKSSICGGDCSNPSVYLVDRMSDWPASFMYVNGDADGEPNGCENDGRIRFQPVLPPGGVPVGELLTWPNPSAGNPVSVAWDSPAKWGQCTIIDVTGRTVFDERVRNRSTIQGTRFLTPGYYWARVEDPNGVHVARILVVE